MVGTLRNAGEGGPVKLDLGCGEKCKEGFEGVDLHEVPGVKHLVNLFAEEWPFEDDSVDEVYTSHLVEHIPHGDGPVDGFYLFWNEVHRISVEGARVTVIHPYGKNNRAFQDPTHRRFLVEDSWRYLDQEWLAENQIGHYTGFTGDFEVARMQGTRMDSAVLELPDEIRGSARAWFWNVIPDLHVELTVRK